MSPPTASLDEAFDLKGQPLPLGPLVDAYVPVTGAWRTVTPLPGGKNDHFRVDTDAGLLWLRRSHRQKALPALLAQLRLQEELRWRGFPAPRAVATDDGTRTVTADGRLWSAAWDIPSSSYDPQRAAHLDAAAWSLAKYHRIAAADDVTELFAGAAERSELTSALGAAVAAEGGSDALSERAAAVVQRLEALSPSLPRVVVHGGCRRASMRYRGDELVGVLDFDSARPDVRVLDLAVALHDFGKVFGPPDAPETRVALDLGRVARFVTTYRAGAELTGAEREALPLLLVAKRLKRGLGRRRRVESGEPVSANDVRKVAQEAARVAWLDTHEKDIAEALRR